MSTDPLALVTVDVGGTLGTVDGPGITAALLSASPLAREDAVLVLRRQLHTVPVLTGHVVEAVCQALQIPTTAFPRDVTPAPLRLIDGALKALERISAHLPVVTLSNVTCVEADLDSLSGMLSPWVSAHFPSCRIGFAKPDPRAFQTVAAAAGVEVGQTVHIGDHWECDVLGAVNAGARAIWISAGRTLPGDCQFARPNVLVADDLATAADHVLDLYTRSH